VGLAQQRPPARPPPRPPQPRPMAYGANDPFAHPFVPRPYAQYPAMVPQLQQQPHPFPVPNYAPAMPAGFRGYAAGLMPAGFEDHGWPYAPPYVLAPAGWPPLPTQPWWVVPLPPLRPHARKNSRDAHQGAGGSSGAYRDRSSRRCSVARLAASYSAARSICTCRHFAARTRRRRRSTAASRGPGTSVAAEHRRLDQLSGSQEIQARLNVQIPQKMHVKTWRLIKRCACLQVRPPRRSSFMLACVSRALTAVFTCLV